MMNQFAAKVTGVLAVVLFVGAIVVVALIGERVLAAMLDAWKFAETGHRHGIDLGARSSLQFVFLCLAGTTSCCGIMRMQPDSSRVVAKIVLLANIMYFCAGAAIVTMVSTNLAYLYCGR